MCTRIIQCLNIEYIIQLYPETWDIVRSIGFTGMGIVKISARAICSDDDYNSNNL